MSNGLITTRRKALLAAAAGALAVPAIARGQGQVRLTLGHNAAAGNPRSVAAERMAQQLKERRTAASTCASPARRSSATTSPC